MRLFFDANIFLEVLLDQTRAEEVTNLLSAGNQHHFFLSDFTLHSIGVLLFRHKLHETYQQFIKDIIFTSGFAIVSLSPGEMFLVAQASKNFNIDFDDAYQYAAASKQNLVMVSFDKDFDKTDLKRKEPADILNEA
jgi:hypothetical protein